MKRIALLLLAALMVLTLACTGPKLPEVEIPAWSFTVVTADGEKVFTSADAAKLEIVTLEVTTTKDGVESTDIYVGVRLADILAAVGVADCSGVTIVAADDYEVAYERDIALANDTILAWERNGAVIDTEPPLRMVPNQNTRNLSVKNAAKAIVIP
ncbi:MAG: molybdopterin-dependent oxidoreductase [Clostridiales bacterium]|nr:molybdopterin-dependent oxidoreductase [Clostridiales bacterium]